jgi:tetratricopeptide (TPR) repeat protein
MFLQEKVGAGPPERAGKSGPQSSRSTRRPALRTRRRWLRAMMAPLLLLFVAACASSGRRDLHPRSADEHQLRQEAAATASPEPLYQLSLLYLEQNRIDDAVLVLQECLQRDADYTPALTLLARTLYQAGRVFEALDWFSRRPVEAWPEPVQINIALLQAEAGNTIEARHILESRLQGAWSRQARSNLAYLDLLDEETMTARKNLETLIRQNIDSPEVLNNLAVARLRDGDVEGSVEILQRLTSTHRDFAVAHMNLALLLQHWLFDEKGAARAQEHLDTMVQPLLSEAVVDQLLDPAFVERTAPPVPPPPAEERP